MYGLMKISAPCFFRSYTANKKQRKRKAPWWDMPDLNRRPRDPKSRALPSALIPRVADLSRLSSCRFRVCFNTDDERLPRVRIPIRFRGFSRASFLWAYLWARMRSVRYIPIHLSGGTYPASVCNVQAMFAGSGIPPAAAPSFRGATLQRNSHEVSRIEPSGQGISTEPRTTHGFGVGGTGRIRTDTISLAI